MALTDVNENTTITLSMWNNVIGQTTFSQFRSDTYGELNPYLVADKFSIMNNTTSFATRFAANKDIRSNYMTFVVNPSAAVPIPLNTWTSLDNTYGTVTPFNNYYTDLTGDSGTLLYGRIKSGFNLNNFSITTGKNSLYYIYANLKYINPSVSVNSAFLRILYNGDNGPVVSVDRNTNSITSGRTTYAQASILSPYYESVPYRVQVYVSSLTGLIVEFGYLEIISKGTPCGGSV